MFSSTTMASSTIIPMPRVSPPRLIVLIDISVKNIRANVAMTEIGIAVPMISVLLMLFRKNQMIKMAKMPPISVSWTSVLIDARIKAD